MQENLDTLAYPSVTSAAEADEKKNMRAETERFRPSRFANSDSQIVLRKCIERSGHINMPVTHLDRCGNLIEPAVDVLFQDFNA